MAGVRWPTGLKLGTSDAHQKLFEVSAVKLPRESVYLDECFSFHESSGPNGSNPSFFWRTPMNTLTGTKVSKVALAVAICLSPALQAQANSAVDFAVAVPPAPATMKSYGLTPTKAPVAFLNEVLAGDKLPAVQLERNTLVSRGTTGKTEQDRLRAYADPVSGDTHFIPNFAELVGAKAPHAKAVAPLAHAQAESLARAALSDPRFIPKDATQLHVDQPITVKGGSQDRASRADSLAAAAHPDNAKTVLTIVPATRYADGLPVYGAGSHAVVSLANDGTIVGALRRWRTASAETRIHTTATPASVRADIERQLEPQLGVNGSHATVDKIELAYYDGNADYLQPVYHFEATVASSGHKVGSGRISGFVPVGATLEPVPDLAAPPKGLLPTQPRRAAEQAKIMPADTTSSYITLGEYVNSDTSNGAYVDMANNFLSGLTFLDSIVPGWTPTVSRTQWYYAYPFEVNSPWSEYYMNAVNVAYTEPHGDWLENTTYSNYADFWYVTDIGTNGNPGFGAAAGGVLATWIIMSCEVVPSMYDRQNEAGGSDNPYTAFDAWWPVFQGLHNVLGFRTEMMYPDDTLNFEFGYDASLGGDVNAAWFQEVGAYGSGYGTYPDGHLIGSPLVNYDRASTMIDGRDLGQSIFDVTPQTASDTLYNFWMDN
jgi:hypothetical protein